MTRGSSAVKRWEEERPRQWVPGTPAQESAWSLRRSEGRSVVCVSSTGEKEGAPEVREAGRERPSHVGPGGHQEEFKMYSESVETVGRFTQGSGTI